MSKNDEEVWDKMYRDLKGDLVYQLTFASEESMDWDYFVKMAKEAQEAHAELKACGPKTCVSCNGSGYYDHDGSPECGACNGAGKQRL